MVYRTFGGRVVSALDSRPKAPGSIPGGVTSRVSLSDLRSPLCGKVTVQVCRPSGGTLSRHSVVDSAMDFESGGPGFDPRPG